MRACGEAGGRGRCRPVRGDGPDAPAGRHAVAAIPLRARRAGLWLLAWLALVVFPAHGQTPYYARTAATFDWIDPSAHTTAVLTSGASCSSGSYFGAAQDDDITAQINIGFTFNFGGTNYTQVQIQSNGRVQFNNGFCGYGTQTTTVPRTYPYNYPDANVVRSMRVYGADIFPGLSGGTIRYATLGTAPNRRFVVTWFNVLEFAAPTSFMNFQVILYESTNEFVYQFKDTLNPTLGRAQVGWQLTTTDFDTLPFGSIGTLAYTAVRFYPAPAKIAEYRMDETGWAGAANEVVDSSGNARHGQAANGATTADGSRAYTSTADGKSTCRYGAFDGVNDYVALASFPNLDAAFSSGGFTITAWIRSRDRAKSGQRILIDDEGDPGAAQGWGFSLGDGGAGMVRFFSRSTSPIILDTPAVVANDTWYFVVAIADFAASRKTMYVYDATGVLLAQASHTYTGAFASHSGTASIGGETNASPEGTSGFRFTGNLDEIRVYRGALAPSVLQAILVETRGCADASATLGRFNAFESTTAAGSITGAIKTKVSGVSFSQSTGNLAIVAVNAGRTAVDTTFTGTVKVELLDASAGGAVDSNGCSASGGWPVIQTLPDQTFAAGNNGRIVLAAAPTENRAWRQVRVRVSFPASGTPTQVGCSTDAFAIRPDRLQFTGASDLDWGTAGTTRSLANVSATGGIVHRAGRAFTLRASAVNGAGTTITNYDGSPSIFGVNLRLPAPSTCPTCRPGAFAAGTWTNSAGVLRTDTATYSEAGALAIEIEDRTWAIVDVADSNETERYVPSATLDVGRFVPDRFDVSITSAPVLRTFGAADASCNASAPAPRRSFTYVGQPFDLNAPLEARVEAKNAAGTITANYRGELWKLGAGALTQAATCGGSDPSCVYTATTTAGGASATIRRTYAYTTSPVLSPGWDTSLAGGAIPSVTSNEDGSGRITHAAADRLAFARNATAPLAPFAASVALTVTAADAAEAAVTGNGTIDTATAGVVNPLAFDAGNAFRYGRLRLVNAYGSQLQPLVVPMETQYWNGIGFTVNSADHCTTIAIGSIGLGNFGGQLVAGETSASITAGAFLAGAKPITLRAPGAGNQGSVQVTTNLGPGATESLCVTDTFVTAGAGQTWLRGRWCGTAYDKDPTARATFGVYRGGSPLIFRRENY